MSDISLSQDYVNNHSRETVEKQIKEQYMSKNLYSEAECEYKAKNLINSIFNGIKSNAEKWNAKKEDDNLRYQAAKAQEQYLKEHRAVAEYEYTTNPNAETEKKFQLLNQTYEDAELETEIARDRFSHTNSFAGKMNSSAILAEYIVGGASIFS